MGVFLRGARFRNLIKRIFSVATTRGFVSCVLRGGAHGSVLYYSVQVMEKLHQLAALIRDIGRLATPDRLDGLDRMGAHLRLATVSQLNELVHEAPAEVSRDLAAVLDPLTADAVRALAFDPRSFEESSLAIDQMASHAVGVESSSLRVFQAGELFQKLTDVHHLLSSVGKPHRALRAVEADDGRTGFQTVDRFVPIQADDEPEDKELATWHIPG